MALYSNYHTHTLLCDGADSPEAVVRAAIGEGLTAIGFSGHSHTVFDWDFCIGYEAVPDYQKEIARLKEKYADKIDVFCGIEQDFYGSLPWEAYDYVIGSVHYVEKHGRFIPVDESRARLTEDVRMHWGGDMMAFVKDYYRTVADLPKKMKMDVIGHFDLVMKFNEKHDLFDPESPEYLSAAQEALEALSECGARLEINTGAISRGYRTEPYPERRWLKKWIGMGGKILLSSDSHAKETLTDHFEQAEGYARACGFSGAADVNEAFRRELLERKSK